MSDVQIDLTQFRQAMREVLRDSRKTEAEILNRQALNIIKGGKGVKGVIKRMPRASAADINKLTPKQLAGAVIRRAKREGRYPIPKGQWKAEIQAEKNRRKKAIGYTAGPGWHKAAVALGGKGVGKLLPEFPQSEAAKGGGEKATPESLIAMIENTAPAAAKIGQQALQDAINDVARDMVQHARDRMQRVFDRRSGR